MPTVSVVIPVYNRAAVVRRAVDSVLAQTLTDFELIVVDDGSSDGSPEIVAGIDDPRVRLIRLPVNGGGNAARNRGIREAAAPIVAFLDSDDYFLPHKLVSIVALFEERSDLGLAVDSFRKVYPVEQDRRDVARRNPVLSDNAAFLDALFLRRIWKSTSGMAVRRDAVIRAGLFDETLKRRQDYDLIVRMAAVGRCASTDEILWVKTNSADGISASLETGVAALTAFYERHPAYHSTPSFQHGFALDIARHFSRVVGRGGFGRIGRDSKVLAQLLGPARFAAMLAQGTGRLVARRLGLDQLRASPAGAKPRVTALVAWPPKVTR